MLGFFVRRLLWLAVLLGMMSLITFVVFFVVPPENVRAGRGSGDVELSLRESYQLEQASLPLQYAEYVWTVVSEGSLGESFVGRRPVTDILIQGATVTGSLIVGGTLLFLLIAIPIGIFSALRPRSLLDRTTMVLVLIGVSAHPVWIGLILSYVLGFKLGVTPIGGYCDFFTPIIGCNGPVDWAYHLLLPWLTFAILFAALYARMVRASVIEALDEDFVRTARAKGAASRRVLRSHVLRNAMLPVVTMLSMDVGLAFGGSVFVETVYGLPGIGRMSVMALQRRDLPVILGVVLLVTTAIALFNLVVDVVYAWLDPRVRATRVSGLGPHASEPATRERPGARPGQVSQRAQARS